MQYQTKDGDRLDVVVFKYYGFQHGAYEVVLQANQNLAQHGVVFPAGLIIRLPELPKQGMQQESVNVWE